MKLQEIANDRINLKRLALELQSMLLDAELDGFECELQGVTEQDKLIAVKLVVAPAPDAAVKSQHGKVNRRLSWWTGNEHVIELYDGPTVDLGTDSVFAVSGLSYHKLNAGVYFFSKNPGRGKSCMRQYGAKHLVGFEVGLTQQSLERFAKDFINGWGQ